MEELAEHGAKIGSDVSFCVYGGTALATGRGEKIQELPAPPNCWVILAKPTIGVSTADIYGNLKLNEIIHPNTKQMIEAIENKDYDLMCESIGNVLEAVTLKLYPEVAVIKRTDEKIWSRCSINEWKWSNCIWASSTGVKSAENL